MTATQISARENFCRRVLELPDEDFFQIKQYLDDMLPHIMSPHIPNPETAAAIREGRDGNVKSAKTMKEFFEAMCRDDEDD